MEYNKYINKHTNVEGEKKWKLYRVLLLTALFFLFLEETIKGGHLGVNFLLGGVSLLEELEERLMFGRFFLLIFILLLLGFFLVFIFLFHLNISCSSRWRAGDGSNLDTGQSSS